MSASYTPAAGGSLLVVSGTRAVILAEKGDNAPRPEEVLDALVAPDAVEAVLELLMRDGLSAMPAFGFAELVGGVGRVLVRGDVTASAGGQDFSGGDYSTWGEHRVRDITEIVLAADGGDGVDGDPRSLPLSGGAVLASAVALAAGDGPDPDIGTETDTATGTAAAGATAGTQGTATAPTTPTLISPPEQVNTPAVPAASLPDTERDDQPAGPAPASIQPVATPTAPATASAPATPAAAPEQAGSGHGVSEQTIVEYTRADADPGYSHLFEETIVRPIEHAAVREDSGAADFAAPPTPVPVVAPDPAPGLAEHDGLTIVSGDLAKLRAEAAAAGPRTGDSEPLSAATATASPLTTELRFSNGTVEHLTGLVIVGRSPSSGKVSAGRVPRLITIDDDPDLSRSHVQIELQGGAVVVTDLHSRNGTSVILPGRSPEKLRGGVPTTVIDGTIVDLGGGLTITVREGAEGTR